MDKNLILTTKIYLKIQLATIKWAQMTQKLLMKAILFLNQLQEMQTEECWIGKWQLQKLMMLKTVLSKLIIIWKLKWLIMISHKLMMMHKERCWCKQTNRLAISKEHKNKPNKSKRWYQILRKLNSNWILLIIQLNQRQILTLHKLKKIWKKLLSMSENGFFLLTN